MQHIPNKTKNQEDHAKRFLDCGIPYTNTHLANDLCLVVIRERKNRERKVFIGQAVPQRVPHCSAAVGQFRAVAGSVHTWQQSRPKRLLNFYTLISISYTYKHKGLTVFFLFNKYTLFLLSKHAHTHMFTNLCSGWGMTCEERILDLEVCFCEWLPRQKPGWSSSALSSWICTQWWREDQHMNTKSGGGKGRENMGVVLCGVSRQAKMKGKTKSWKPRIKEKQYKLKKKERTNNRHESEGQKMQRKKI